MNKAVLGLILIGAIGGGAYFFLANRDISPEEKNKSASAGKNQAMTYCECIEASKTNPEKASECEAINQAEMKRILSLITDPDVQKKQMGQAAQEAWTKEKGKCVE